MKKYNMAKLIRVIMVLALIISSTTLISSAFIPFSWTQNEQHIATEFRGIILTDAQTIQTPPPLPPTPPEHIPENPIIQPPPPPEYIPENPPIEPQDAEHEYNEYEYAEYEAEEDEYELGEYINIADAGDNTSPDMQQLQELDDGDRVLTQVPTVVQETNAEPLSAQEADYPEQEYYTNPVYEPQPEPMQHEQISYAREPVRSAVPAMGASGFFNLLYDPVASGAGGIIERIMAEGIQAITIGDRQIPLSAGAFNNQVWVLANFILSIAGLVLMVILIIRTMLRKRSTGRYTKKRNFIIMKVMLIMPLAAKLLFLITQDMSLPMVLFDWWTLVHAIVFVFMVLCYVSAFGPGRYYNTAQSNSNLIMKEVG